MQTKLFEAYEAGRTSSGTADRCDHPGGVVVVRSCTSATYGTQSNEFWIQNGQGGISFSELVRESSGHLVIPIDPSSREDALLLDHITQALTGFVRLTQKSGQVFLGNRINDVGKRFEYMIAEALTKTPLEVVVLGRPGYPDCVLRQGERVTYLEIKTSASLEKQSNRYLKTFCFSSGKKIKADARHLLLKVRLEEVDDKIWKVVAWQLRDLSTLKTRLKTEFSAGFGDLADIRLLGSSEAAGRHFACGQQVLDSTMPPPSGGRGPRRGSGRGL